MSLWISLPCSEQEKEWLEWLGGPWRLSGDRLWRHSDVEAALVTDDVWHQWKLPEPHGPIITFAVADLDAAQRVVAAGAKWASEVAPRPWGIDAGFLRFPSGLLVEIAVIAKKSG